VNAAASPIRVLVAEDEPDARLLMELQLDLEPDIEVIATVEDGLAAVEYCRRDAPDVVVMDLLMPRMNGLEAIAVLREELPELGLVACTAVAGEVVRAHTDAHAVDLVLKSGDARGLVEAVRRAAGRAGGGAGPVMDED
jgi:DNA-binding NarL/FixJ family response regulator